MADYPNTPTHATCFNCVEYKERANPKQTKCKDCARTYSRESYRWKNGVPPEKFQRPLSDGICSFCGEQKPRYQPQRSICKECHRARVKRYRQEKPEQYRAGDRRRREAMTDEQLERQKHAQQRWVANSPERRREVSRNSRRNIYAADPAKGAEKARQYRHAHPEKIRTQARERYRKNPQVRLNQRKYGHTRRARLAAVTVEDLPIDILDRLIAKQGRRCAGCRQKFTKKKFATLDHIVPLAKGGCHNRTNLQALCQPCNSGKQALDETLWRRRKGMLL